jgi:hypothetical protein
MELLQVKELKEENYKLSKELTHVREQLSASEQLVLMLTESQKDLEKKLTDFLIKKRDNCDVSLYKHAHDLSKEFIESITKLK